MIIDHLSFYSTATLLVVFWSHEAEAEAEALGFVKLKPKRLRTHVWGQSQAFMTNRSTCNWANLSSFLCSSRSLCSSLWFSPQDIKSLPRDSCPLKNIKNGINMLPSVVESSKKPAEPINCAVLYSTSWTVRDIQSKSRWYPSQIQWTTTVLFVHMTRIWLIYQSHEALR